MNWLIRIICFILSLSSITIPIPKETVPEAKQEVKQESEIKQYISQLCEEYEISYSLVCAVIEKESNWHSNSISAKGHKGLMQIDEEIHKKTMEKLGCTDLLNEYENVKVGIYILASYGCEDERHMLMCYSMGVGKANRQWANGTRTTPYVEKVMELRSKYENILTD